MRMTVEPAAGPLKGTLTVPGDKSISHRAVLFSAMAEGVSHASGVLDADDVRSSIEAVRALGARVEVTTAEDGSLGVEVEGWGDRGPTAPDGPVDCGNSGTTARLLMGVLAGWPGLEVTLTGDDSLTRRPMRRVTEPLARMGARFDDDDGRLPVTVHGAHVKARDVRLKVASAQVKTAVMLAATRADGYTEIHEPARSRDHTELMLPAYGVRVDVSSDRRACRVEGVKTLSSDRHRRSRRSVVRRLLARSRGHRADERCQGHGHAAQPHPYGLPAGARADGRVGRARPDRERRLRERGRHPRRLGGPCPGSGSPPTRSRASWTRSPCSPLPRRSRAACRASRAWASCA